MNAPSRSLKELFLAALEVVPADRAAWLERECADPALREHLGLMLAAHDEPQSLLDRPAALARAGSLHQGDVGPTIDQPTTETPGAVIGPYKLLEQIGEGGMGTVWMAQQTEPVKRLVAVKLIKAGLDSRQVIARFDAERQALALMDHPNIARVLDGGTTNAGRPYFVMDLVKGVPITRYCDEHHLTPRQRLELFIPVCSAVQHAHQKGIIHRDLKPSNVLVALYDGRPVPKVIDFGVAKAAGQPLTDKTLVTGFGTLVGTLEYMSPEQAEVNQLDIDTRSDVYSLGVLLYELLTGSTPFTRKDLERAGMLEMLRVIREQEPSKPSTKLSTAEGLPTLAANRGTEPAKLTGLVRGELDWIVMKALEKDRGRRYETANGFAMDVQRYLADEPVLACPPSVGYRLRKFARRNRGPVLAASLVILVLVVGVIGTTWGLVRAVAEAKQKQDALQDKDAALTAAERSKRDADETLFASYLDHARALRTSRRPGQRFESLDVVKRATELARRLDLPAAKFDALRDAAVAALALPDLYPVGPWVPRPADAYAIDFDEARTLSACTDRRGNCSVRRVADNREIYRLRGRGGPAWPCLSPDGQFLAVRHFPEKGAGRSAVEVWKLGPTAALKIVSEENAGDTVFHPHLPQVALVYVGGAIGLFELPGGRLLKRLPPVTLTREVNIALHPTEPVVAVCSYFGSVVQRPVQIRDLGTGAVLVELPQDGRPCGVAWSPDGRTLAVGQMGPDRIRLYDRITHQVVRTFETNSPAPIAFNPAGDRLVSKHPWGVNVALFDVGTGQQLFADGPSGVRIRFSRDGRRLTGAIRDGKLGSWQVGDGREYRTLVSQAWPDKAGFNYSVAVSPDGRLVAAGLTNGIGLWDLAGGSELAFIPTPKWPHPRVLFEPSGGLLVLGPTGLSRWPIGKESGTAGPWVVGPPERLRLPPGSALGQSRDGRVIATCSRAVSIEEPYAGWWVLHADRPDRPIRLDRGADVVWIAVSPDGRWVVTVTHWGDVSKLWDARNGRLVRRLAEFGAGYPRFSPDSRWLSTDADGGRLYAVETGEPGPRLGGVGTFAPDGKLVAVPGGGGVRLVDPATGRTLATLEDPNREPIWLPVFTPDGTRLIGVGFGKGVHVWDLRLIRRQLAEMGLDWDAPPYPPAAERKPAPPPKVEVLLTPERTVRHAILKGRWDEAARYSAKAIEVSPADYTAHFLLAASLLKSGDTQGYRRTCEAALKRFADGKDPYAVYIVARACGLGPDAIADPTGVVRHMERLVDAHPSAWSLHALGLAHHRAKQYDKAIARLEESRKLDAHWDNHTCVNGFVLALAHQRLGHGDAARQELAGAIERLEKGAKEKGSAETFPIHVVEWVTCLILRQEAETEIAKAPKERHTKK